MDSIYDKSMNTELMEAFEAKFKPLGIVAYSNCCRYGCSGAYDEGDPNFEGRRLGIYFIRLHLNGMNYDSRPSSCYASYTDFNYLKENWDKERDLLVEWCKILGLEEGDYRIVQPSDGGTAIAIEFNTPVVLEEGRYANFFDEEQIEEGAVAQLLGTDSVETPAR